ncbi:MAG: GIY-YIG nuclease family protein [Patescibacteria group bacterium]
MFYVYVLKSKVDGSIYVGYTNDLKRRLVEHNERRNRSTKHKAPFQLVYYEAYNSRADARNREDNLKRHSGALIHLKRRAKNSMEGNSM